MRWFRWAMRVVDDGTKAKVVEAQARLDDAHRAHRAAEAETVPIQIETARLQEFGRRNHFGESLMLGMRLRGGS